MVSGTLYLRRPELVSGSISRVAQVPALVAGWMLKQVQHDGSVGDAL